MQVNRVDRTERYMGPPPSFLTSEFMEVIFIKICNTSRRIKWNEEWEDRVEEVILGGITNIKGLWKSYMKTYYCRRFLKYVYRYKMNLNGVAT